MQLEVIKILQHVLEFLKSFDAQQAHNMILIMLDPCFKVLHVVENLIFKLEIILENGIVFGRGELWLV
jgi:hypothetical protein